jgi:hypothetical protein
MRVGGWPCVAPTFHGTGEDADAPGSSTQVNAQVRRSPLTSSEWSGCIGAVWAGSLTQPRNLSPQSWLRLGRTYWRFWLPNRVRPHTQTWRPEVVSPQEKNSVRYYASTCLLAALAGAAGIFALEGAAAWIPKAPFSLGLWVLRVALRLRSRRMTQPIHGPGPPGVGSFAQWRESCPVRVGRVPIRERQREV